MTILMIDGFDIYDGNSLTPAMRGWQGNNTPGANQTGRFTGSKCVYLASASNPMYWPLNTISTVSMGWAMKLDNTAGLSSTGTDLVYLMNGTTVVAKMGVRLDGSLVTGRGDFTANLIAASAASLIVANAWNYVEIEFTRSATAGVFKVYLNGTLVINSTAANTGSLDLTRAGFVGPGNPNHFVDDFYITDTGVRLGERRVEYLVPSADTSVQWTPSTGTAHFSLLDEVPSNSDTDYISSATVGQKDQFALADLSTVPATVDAVQTIMVARKDDAATRTVRSNLVSGSTTSNGTTRAVAGTYSIWSDLYPLNPDTTAAWTGTSANAAQVGVEVVS